MVDLSHGQAEMENVFQAIRVFQEVQGYIRFPFVLFNVLWEDGWSPSLSSALFMRLFGLM